MKLFKSMFWLIVAFVAIGPQVNAVDSVEDLSRQAVQTGAGLVAGQLQQVDCTNVECMGSKLVISSGLEMVTHSMSEGPSTNEGLVPEPLDPSIPFPRPRISRAG